MAELVTRKHIVDLLELLPDLGDEKVMNQAWSECAAG